MSANTRLECLDLTSSGVGVAIGAEGEGGHILFRPLCQDNQCKISALVLNNAQFNDKAGGKRSSGVGYSNGGRESHDFSVHDQKFKEQMEGLKKFLEMSAQADSIKLARVGHIDFTAWLLQYLEEVSGNSRGSVEEVF